MHAMLEQNPGLKSRFQKYVQFEDWSAERSARFTLQQLAKEFGVRDAEQVERELARGFGELVERPGWANGRDAIKHARSCGATQRRESGKAGGRSSSRSAG